MLLKFGWYLDFFMYLNAMKILDICLITFTKTWKWLTLLPRSALSKSNKLEVRTKKEKRSQSPRFI